MLRRESLVSAGSMLLVFLASQHHTLHMLLMTVGVGGAGMGFMTVFPVVRRAMLVLSLLMTGWTLYQLSRPHRPKPMRLTGGLSAAVSLGLIVWSVYQYGM